MRAGQQHVVREHRGLHAGAAHLGQRDGAGALGQPCLEGGLARRRLALAGHQAVAEQHLADRVGGDAGALDGGADGGAAVADLGPLYLAGVAGVALLLIYEQSLVSEHDLSQVKKAFDLNGYVGILYMATTMIAVYVAG